jgi:hypothetical protein
MKQGIFVHVPRTAGSSVWHGLAHAAPRYKIGVLDLYHESIQRYGAARRARQVLYETLSETGRRKYIFHHHTAENIGALFGKRRTVWATILRDPVDRYLSDVLHYKRLSARTRDLAGYLKSDLVELDVNHTGERSAMAESLPPDGSRIGEILDQATSESHFANYYVKFFWSLCMNVRRLGYPNSVTKVRSLARTMRRRFAVIGAFDNLQNSYDEILKAFDMETESSRLGYFLMKGPDRPDIPTSIRDRLRRLFELDYLLLDELKRA